MFLPTSSPDLSPALVAFSKLKAFLRRVEARTPEALQEALGQALVTIPVHDALGCLSIVAHAQTPVRLPKRENLVGKKGTQLDLILIIVEQDQMLSARAQCDLSTGKRVRN